jgi:hypothetical protein
MTEVPLRRNRDFVMLQAGQLLSAIGTASTTVAYPLLALTVTHSPARAGWVTFARVIPSLLVSLPGGVAADRLNRKTLMIVSDTCRAAAAGSLAVTILLGDLRFWLIPVVAFAEGSFRSLFSSSAAGALRSVVPASQVPAAVAAQRGRSAKASLAGPPIGGALFGISPALPFIADAVSDVFSVLSLILIRTRSRKPGGRTRRACGRSSARASGSCGASRSCAPPRSCTARLPPRHHAQPAGRPRREQQYCPGPGAVRRIDGGACW